MRIITTLRTYWFSVTLLLLTIITVLSLIPLPDLPPVPGNDKTHHFIAYSALMFSIALRKPKNWVLIGILLVCWSGAIELIQPFVNRYGEWLDLLANSGGVVIGALLAIGVNWLFPDK